MREPVRILSDLHLGHKVSRIPRVAALRPLLEGAGTVIFNGDTWQELSRSFRKGSGAMLEDLKSLCAELGCEAVFLSGNHDPGWPGKGWLTLAGGRILITHGDALLYDGAPWKRELLTHQEKVRGIWADHPLACSDPEVRLRLARQIAAAFPTRRHPHGRALWRRTWDALMPPQRALKILEAWATQAQAGGNFCDRYFPQTEIMIIGHFHFAGSWLVRGRRIINTGSFVSPGAAHWVEWHNGWLTHGRVDESTGQYRAGKVLGRWRLG
jgi:predicted phosphodiesterase